MITVNFEVDFIFVWLCVFRVVVRTDDMDDG